MKLLWKRLKARARSLDSLPVSEAENLEGDEEFAMDFERISLAVPDSMHLRLLTSSNDLDVAKSELIRACISLALPVLEEHPYLLSSIDIVDKKNAKVQHKKR